MTIRAEFEEVGLPSCGGRSQGEEAAGGRAGGRLLEQFK